MLRVRLKRNEGVPIGFEVDTGAVHTIISEKLYLRHFSKLMLHENDLLLKDYVGYTFKSLGK